VVSSCTFVSFVPSCLRGEWPQELRIGEEIG
jgi:hypothetical protein